MRASMVRKIGSCPKNAAIRARSSQSQSSKIMIIAASKQKGAVSTFLTSFQNGLRCASPSIIRRVPHSSNSLKICRTDSGLLPRNQLDAKFQHRTRLSLSEPGAGSDGWLSKDEVNATPDRNGERLLPVATALRY